MAHCLAGDLGGTPAPGGTFNLERIPSSRMPIAAVWEVVSSIERRLDRGSPIDRDLDLIYMTP